MIGRRAFRAVCGRTRPELEQATDNVSSYFRHFSTSNNWLADEDSNKGSSAPPNLRQRSLNTANEVKAFARNRASPVQANTAASPEGASNQPRVIDVKSLPRGGLRGRGRGLGRGSMRGGAAVPPHLRSPSPTGTNRFARGGFAGRGGRGRGGRGGGGRGKRRDGDQDGENAERQERERVRRDEDKENAKPDPAEEALEQVVRFGTTEVFNPAPVTAEALTDFMPTVPSASGSKSATVLENLQYLGTGDRVGTALGLQASGYGERLQQGGLLFFAEPETKAGLEQAMQEKRYDDAVTQAYLNTAEDEEPAPVERNNEVIMMDGVEESIKQVILNKAVAGQHEAIKQASDPVGVARNWHLRSETWSEKETNLFEAKLTSLLNKAKPQPRAKA
ncbi:unnamed protein product [Clonostachys rosea f. rosea IK726]|uniref:Uncharacterized protein n=1 Tax=Clonostachys rosea f. rosea IK726 TaxID=1349383 RepID=A0ACA9UNQ4_BIOOC|nr:unnamed protein product [Clonostachys rosea f. rosea IK726]